jgi:hypothetical protein
MTTETNTAPAITTTLDAVDDIIESIKPGDLIKLPTGLHLECRYCDLYETSEYRIVFLNGGYVLPIGDLDWMTRREVLDCDYAVGANPFE